ncbi:MAG: hypothetical protein WCS20_05255 [Alphaproteobacteria bacterium]
MLPLLAALGLRLAIQPRDAMPVDEFCDASIWLRDLRKASKLRAALRLRLRLENWLTRPAARPFLGDYRLTGVQTVTRLVRKSGWMAEDR